MKISKSMIAAITLLSICAFFSACTVKYSGSTNSADANTNTAPAVKTVAAPSQPETLTHTEAGIQFDLPAGWQKKQDGDTLVVNSPDNGVAIVFSVSTEEDWDKAVDAITEELDKIIKNPEFNGEAKEGNLNGMSTVTNTGTGIIEGQKIEWSFTLLDAKKPVLIVGFADPQTWEKNQAAFNKMVDSIRKA